jgi:formylglycine-generating enzyme required for sulfatase activity
MASANPDLLPPDRNRIGFLARLSAPVFFILCLFAAGLTGPFVGLVALFVAALVADAVGVPAKSAGAILALSGLLFTVIGFVLAIVALRRKRRRDFGWEKPGRDRAAGGGLDGLAQSTGSAALREGPALEEQGGTPYEKYEPPAAPKTRIFISYSRKDMAFADQLETALRARGFEPLIDRSEIYAFEDWWQRIEKLIGRADTIVFVLSPDAVRSDVALKEVAYAASLNKRFAPIVCRPVDDTAVPEALRRLNFIFFNDPARFEASADQLAEALQVDIRWIRQHTEYGEAARRWAAAGRPSGLLLRPPALDEAEYLVTYRPHGAPPPTPEMQSFFLESRKAETVAKTRSRRAQIFTYALLVSVILGLIGWINQAAIADQWRWWTVTRPYAAAQFWPHVLKAAKEQALKPGDAFKECEQDCPEMIVLPAGSFTMGGSTGDEQPHHTVTLARPFAVSKYEVTFADWDACVDGGGCGGYRPNDQGWGRGRQPAINVNWDDAQQYVKWLSDVTGKTYRLLSESEYEYATRAGTSTAYPWGDDIKLNGKVMADCSGCGSKWDGAQAAPVGSFPPNKFGLYDMVGNVWEWTEDCAHNNYDGAPVDGSAWRTGGDCSNLVGRGGAFPSTPDNLQSGYRASRPAVYRDYFFGFRAARTLLGP